MQISSTYQLKLEEAKESYLIAEDNVSHAIENQDERDNQWCKEEICDTKKSEEQNFGDFAVVRYWRNFHFIIFYTK